MLVHCRPLIQWNNGLGCWWFVAQCTVWAFRVIVLSPILDDDLGLLERVEDFAAQKFVAHSSVEALAVAVFPRATWRDVSGLCADGLDRKRRAIALVDVFFCFFEKEPSSYGGFLWMIRYKIT